MDSKPRITLHIPDPEGFEDDERHVYIAAPALALHAPRERRRKERLQQRIASQQRPVADHDVGWDF
jgi:hypothetical protein